MKILHSADWHLGQRFYGRDRLAEHQEFFRFLLHTIERENIDLHIVAGDVFDTTTPSNDASKLYYHFIHETCKLCTTIIIGGNHDSPGFLNAPAELLRASNVHTIGCLPDQLQDTLIRVNTEHGEILVAAVPYLRERDIYKNTASTSPEEMEEAIRKGVIECYENIAKLCEKYIGSMPIIATGHLTAMGGNLSGSERNIHIGNIGSIALDQFPNIFSYIALGHLHRPQKVAEHICYAGSPIPLSFSEIRVAKSLRLIEISKEAIQQRTIALPIFRPLYSLEGTSTEVQKAIGDIPSHDSALPPWLELIVHEEKIHNQDEYRQLAAGRNCEILKISLQHSEEDIAAESINIEELTPQLVFNKKLEQYKGSLGTEELELCFQTLLRELQEGE